MERFTVPQHFNESSNLLRARLGLLDVLNPEQDGVPVSTVERCKKRFRLWVCIKGLCKSSGIVEVLADVYAPSHLPSSFARSIAAKPAGRIFFAEMRASAFSLLIFDQMLGAVRGVKR